MNRRNILIAVVVLIALLVMLLFYLPAMVDPDADRPRDNVTGPGREGAVATGSPMQTPDPDPSVRPERGEVSIK